MEYEINGSKIKVTRQFEEAGITILEALVNSLILNNKKKKDEIKNEKDNNTK